MGCNYQVSNPQRAYHQNFQLFWNKIFAKPPGVSKYQLKRFFFPFRWPQMQKNIYELLIISVHCLNFNGTPHLFCHLPKVYNNFLIDIWKHISQSLEIQSQISIAIHRVFTMTTSMIIHVIVSHTASSTITCKSKQIAQSVTMRLRNHAMKSDWVFRAYYINRCR